MSPFFVGSIEEMGRRIHAGAVEHGFWPCRGRSDEPGEETCRCLCGARNFGEMIALIHSELSEALEAYRKDPHGKDEHCPDFTNLEIEMADAVIRILDTSYGMGLRLGAAIEAKMTYNQDRPFKHGKAF